MIVTSFSVLRLLLRIVGGGVFVIGFFYIIGHAVLVSVLAGDWVIAVLKLAFFPFTFSIWPWFSGLWRIFLLTLIGYWVYQIGGGEPID
jgi:hypothetical protein